MKDLAFCSVSIVGGDFAAHSRGNQLMAARNSGAAIDHVLRDDEPEIWNRTTAMIDLHRFLKNPFDAPGISLEELLAFSTDHQQRLQANNSGGIFSARITATTTALGRVDRAFTENQSAPVTESARTTARAALQLELFKNLLTLALNYPRLPELLDVYMQPGLLMDHPLATAGRRPTSTSNTPGVMPSGRPTNNRTTPQFE